MSRIMLFLLVNCDETDYYERREKANLGRLPFATWLRLGVRRPWRRRLRSRDAIKRGVLLRKIYMTPSIAGLSGSPSKPIEDGIQ